MRLVIDAPPQHRARGREVPGTSAQNRGVPREFTGCRNLFAIGYPFLLLGVGVSIAAAPGPQVVAHCALGAFLLGLAVRIMAVDNAWSRVRRGVGLSAVKGLRLAYWCYVISGLIAAIAGVLYLELAGAVIVGFFAVSWCVLWLWALRRVVNGSQT